jgi:hypothetical protein
MKANSHWHRRLLGWGLLAGLGLGAASAGWCADTLPINLEYPSFQGDFYAAGSVSFPPGAVRSADQILVRASESGDEIATCIREIQTWPDGSLRRADVLFAANNARPANYELVFGDEVRRTRLFKEPAVLPTVAFAVSGAPRAAEIMDVNVGTINVRVDRSPRIYYYWHLAPILLMIGLTWYRARRAKFREQRLLDAA